MWLFFKCIFINPFKKHNKIVPTTIVTTRYTYVVRCYEKLKSAIYEYKYFLHNTFPTNEITAKFVLTNGIYSRRCELVSHFNALYESINNELALNDEYYIDYLRGNIHNKLRKYKSQFDALDSEFLNTLRTINGLQVESSYLYTQSFLDIFKNNNIPRPIERK